MKQIFFYLTLSLFCVLTFSQSTDNYLIKIDNQKIDSEEFLRVYNKNKDITPESEKKSIDEYLDLFINYKLKVIEAENLGYDTVNSFIVEFSGYKNQLAKPYLQNEELKEDLIKEAYERYKYEVHASHILIKCSENAPPEDTLKAYGKIMAIRARVIGGEPFDEVAKATSDDPSVKHNGGDLGYFTAFRMIYQFETAAFNTPVGKISRPVRTREGYHIIKVDDKRPSRGKVKVAHTMTRIPRNASAPELEAAKEKINEAYMALMNGEKWEDVVAKYSENPRTKEIKGEIGWLHTGQAPDEFLDECYKLEVNSFSKPIQTIGGFHIAYILEKQPIESYEEAYEKLSRRIDNDQLRKKALKNLMNSELVSKYKMTVNKENAMEIASVLDSGVYKGTWNPELASKMDKPVISFETKSFTQYDLAKDLSKNKYSEANQTYNKIIFTALEKYSEKALFDYAMEMLPNDYPDYKYLLKEYHDGILLFNLTNDEVWQKAQIDSVGLEKFYEKADKYKWNDRIDVVLYEYENNSFTALLPKLAKKQVKKKLGNDFLISKLCPTDTVPCISFSKKTFEKGNDAITDKLNWEVGSYTLLGEKDKNYMYFVSDIKPSKAKKLNEARGLYVADYQTYLETKWILKLREKYSVEVNQDELSRIKSKIN
jgi:peptidyl-prolyl cis-trans isomerase SurA